MNFTAFESPQTWLALSQIIFNASIPVIAALALRRLDSSADCYDRKRVENACTEPPSPRSKPSTTPPPKSEKRPRSRVSRFIPMHDDPLHNADSQSMANIPALLGLTVTAWARDIALNGEEPGIDGGKLRRFLAGEAQSLLCRRRAVARWLDEKGVPSGARILNHQGMDITHLFPSKTEGQMADVEQ